MPNQGKAVHAISETGGKNHLSLLFMLLCMEMSQETKWGQDQMYM